MTKICSKCKIEKPLEGWWKNCLMKDGYNGQCNSCKSEYLQKNKEYFQVKRREYYKENKQKILRVTSEYRKNNPERAKVWRANDYRVQRSRILRECFGITLEKRTEMFREQQGKCAICGRDESKFKKALAVDHDHMTGKVRGLLCGPCNTGLGSFQESEEILIRASNYILASKKVPSF